MNPLPTVLRPQFEADLLNQTEYLEGEAGAVVADRFFAAVKHAILFLADFPNVGTRCDFANPRLNGLRAWPVDGFRTWLLFFRRVESGLEFVRLLHGHRDWLSMLDSDAETGK